MHFTTSHHILAYWSRDQNETKVGPLANTQFIIIDKEFIAPVKDQKVKLIERYMTPTDDEHPPLIPYYRGA